MQVTHFSQMRIGFFLNMQQASRLVLQEEEEVYVLLVKAPHLQ